DAATTFAGTSYNAGWYPSSNGGTFKFNDNARLALGSNGDTNFFHNNSHFYLQNTTGNINFDGNVVVNDDISVDGHTNLDNVSVAGVSTFSDVVGITSSLNVTGITSINGGYAPQPFTVIGGSHPTPNHNHRQQFVFRTSHGHTDLKFENSYGGNWAGSSVSHTRILWESYGERNASVPGGDYGRQGEFCSIQPIMGVPGQFTNLIFKGNDGVV
ncbi:MAG: hypothetical protein VXY93_17895, partial [Pseudomonadota bacterium]|nr:hypothetical protein [Pseudomonadota bacterium]